MRSDISKHLILAALIAVLLYAVSFTAIQYSRTHKGPWEVTFTTGNHNEAALTVNQPYLGIRNVRLEFSGHPPAARSESSTLKFIQPKETPFELPFGQCIYMDLTFLPGVVTFNFFGHEVEFMPRTLVVDKRQIPWKTNDVIRVTGEGISPKPPSDQF